MKRAYSQLEIKAFDEETREIRGIATTPTPDSYGDIVEPQGASFDLPLPLLWQHRHDQPIGHVTQAKVSKKGIEFVAKLAKIDEPGTLRDRLDEAWQSIKSKLVRGVSIGFTSVEHAYIEGTNGIRFIKWNWLELSAVTIPANVDASIEAIKSAASGPAASGNGPERKPQSRVRGAINLKREDKTMSLRKQIEALEAKRAANVAAMDTLMKDANEQSRSLDEAESEQFDQLEAEVDSVDKDLKRLKNLERFKAQTSVVQTDGQGASQAQASSTRSGSIQLVRKPEKLQPGIGLARIARCIGLANTKTGRRNGLAPSEFARQLYGETSPIYGFFQKDAVPAASTSDSDWAGFLVGDETSVFADFAEFLRPTTILGQFGVGNIPSLRRVPFRVPLISQLTGGEGYWVGEGKGKPLTQWTGTRTTLEPLKVANIAVATEELLRDGSPSADMMLRDELAAALRERLDIDFIDPTKTADLGVSPASITQGITPIGSAGCDADAVRCDMKNLVQEFVDADNPLASGVWILSGNLAVALSFMRNPLGQREFPDIGRMGGSLDGWPVIVSQYVPAGVVALVNAGDIYLADDGGVDIDVSREASLQMLDSSITQDSLAPTASQVVSLWQTNSVGFRAERTINWARRRTSAVALLTEADWGCCETT